MRQSLHHIKQLFACYGHLLVQRGQLMVFVRCLLIRRSRATGAW